MRNRLNGLERENCGKNYLDATSDPIAYFALGTEWPSLPVAFEQFAVVGVKGDRVLIPSWLPIQRIRFRRHSDADRPFGT